MTSLQNLFGVSSSLKEDVSILLAANRAEDKNVFEYENSKTRFGKTGTIVEEPSDRTMHISSTNKHVYVFDARPMYTAVANQVPIS